MISTLEKIEIIVDDYIRDTGRHPIAIILGPKEYVDMCHYIKQNSPYANETLVNGILATEYRGMRLYAKELPGIDLMIDYNEAYDLAKF